MITNIKELYTCLKSDRTKYIRKGYGHLSDIILSRECVTIWRFVILMRLCEYFNKNRRKTIFHLLLYIFINRKYNKRCRKLGLLIGAGVFDEGVQIHHIGNIVINGYSVIGKNCRLHGSNCIGNSHREDDCPTIGDNVRFGVGAKAFGDIYIANNVTIAAGAIVTKSCYEEGVTLAGIPAKIIKHDNSKNCK